MKSPIFIVGANRSGTTLLRLILNAHSRLAIPEEVVYFGSFMAGIPIEKWESPGLNDDAYSRFVKDFVVKKCASLEGVNQEKVTDKILRDKPYDFSKPYRYMLEAWADIHGKNRWGEKTPGNLFYADILLEMFPGAQFIHVVRDPRAGVSSMMNTTFFPKDIVFNALNRHKFMTAGRAILEKAVPENQRMTLRYEDLVLHPEEAVKRICTFLDEPFEASMMGFYKDSSRYMKQDAATKFNKAATKPISADMLLKWKKKLTDSEIAQIEMLCGEEMKEFEYDFEHKRLSLRKRSELHLKRLYWHWQARRHRHIRHFTVKSPMFARFQSRIQKVLGLREAANPTHAKS